MLPQDPHIKSKISEILRKVDKYVKDGKLQEASNEVRRGQEVDPRNMYVHAYFERLSMLKEQEGRNREAAEAKRVFEEAARQKEEAIARRKQEEGEKPLQAGTSPTPYGIQRSARPRQTAAEHAKALQIYNRALFEAWIDGAVTPAEEQKLSELRSSLMISVVEHSELEAGVKRECYIAAFKKLWSSGSVPSDRTSMLSTLRAKFGISLKEFEPIELELLHELRPKRTEGTILVIDDDPGILRIVEGILVDHGFGVRPFATSDEAYNYLRSNTPDLIMSDVNLETSTMGGLSFLEKVRELDHLTEVPFVFLSGLTDEVVIRAGKAVGADDYLTKPFDPETLVAVIRGKLKRFRQLRSVSLN